MAYIRVTYRAKKYKFDLVSDDQLDHLIARGEITHFYRPSEKRWVDVRSDPVRQREGWYQGAERRRNKGGVKPEKQKENTDGCWIESLWQDIENS